MANFLKHFLGEFRNYLDSFKKVVIRALLHSVFVGSNFFNFF